ARRRRGAADHRLAAAIERAAAVVGAGHERDAVADRDRQRAGARDRGARIGIDVCGAGLWPRRPGADAQRAEAGAARQRHPGRAERDHGGQNEGVEGADQKAHDVVRVGEWRLANNESWKIGATIFYSLLTTRFSLFAAPLGLRDRARAAV